MLLNTLINMLMRVHSDQVNERGRRDIEAADVITHSLREGFHLTCHLTL